MKSYVLSITMLFIIAPLYAQYQNRYHDVNLKDLEDIELEEMRYFDFSANKCTYIGGGYNSCDGVAGGGCILTCYGIYVDCATNKEGNYSNYIGVEQYDGYKTLSWHIGYSIPVTHSLKVTPIIGHVNWNAGYWDGSDWWVTDDDIQNNFVPTVTYQGVDFGINISYSFTNYTNWGFFVYASLSKHNIGGGIGFVIGD